MQYKWTNIKNKKQDTRFKLAQGGNKKVRDELLAENQGLVAYAIDKYFKGVSNRRNYSDLKQEGYIGLLKAIENFKPELNNEFSTFAVPYIRGYVMHCLSKELGHYSVCRRTKQKYLKALELMNIGTPEKEIEKKLKIKFQDVRDFLFPEHLYLDKVGIDEQQELDDRLEAELILNRSKIGGGEKEIICRKLGGESFADIGREKDLSRERIRQLYDKGIEVLRRENR